MSKKVTWALVIMMSIAVIGLISVQYYWVKESYQLKEKQFEQLVFQSLRNVSYNIEKKRMLENIKNRQKIKQNSNRALEQLFNNSFHFKDTSSNPLSSWTRSFNDQVNNQMRLFQDMFDVFSPGLNKSYTIKPKELDTIIQNELVKSGIKTKFKYALVKNNRITYASDKNALQDLALSPFKTPLLTKSNNKTVLVMDFPSQKSFIIKQMSIMLISSFVLLSFIVFCFSYAINVIFKQKQLAEMKNDFINNMTHELKTPIATISLASEALNEDEISKNSNQRARFLNVIQQENHRLKNQVEKVLQFAKLDKDDVILQKAEIDIHVLLEDVISAMKVLCDEKNAQISTSLNAKNTNIYADSIHIENIFRNIIDNSLKYSDSKPDILISTQNIQNGIELTFKDNGIGISKADQDKVFEKFFRVHTGNIHDVKGFGLGLSYVQKIMQMHKGNVQIKSDLGQGATFTLFLPFSDKQKMTA